MWAIQESGEDFPSKVGGLFFFGMNEGGAEAEAGEGIAWGLVNWAIRARWAVISEWSSVMSAIICSGECGLFGPSKVAGGTSDIFEFLVEFCVFSSVLSKISFWRKQTLGSKTGPRFQMFLRNCVSQLCQTTLCFIFRSTNQLNCLGLSDNANVGAATLVVLELLLVREFAVTDVTVRSIPGQARAVDVPARLHVIRKSY
jgi:hypothetical protein